MAWRKPSTVEEDDERAYKNRVRVGPRHIASWSDAVGDDDDDDNEGEFYPFSCLLPSPPARPLRPGRWVVRPGTGSRKDWMPLRARNAWVKSLKRNGGPTSAGWPICVDDGTGWPKLPRNPIKTPWYVDSRRTPWCDAYNDNCRFCWACCEKPTRTWDGNDCNTPMPIKSMPSVSWWWTAWKGMRQSRLDYWINCVRTSAPCARWRVASIP